LGQLHGILLFIIVTRFINDRVFDTFCQ
jgi:hypothetical protein